MNYRIGLDIGVTSVGWAVIENDLDGEPIRIVDLGSRIFDAAEVPKTGASLAGDRRKARGARRRNRRKVHRIKRTKQLLVNHNILTEDEILKLYNDKYLTDIYTLRVAGLDRKLSEKELARVLINLVKKRGYKSNSKSEESKNDDSGKTLSAISDNKKLMVDKGYRTVAEMYLKDEKFKLKDNIGENVCDSKGNPIVKIRNSTDDYKTTVTRELLLNEVKVILESQKKYNEKITDNFINEYTDIFSSQRNYDEGPAYPSKYGGELIEKMLGNCTFEEGEKRAPKATYTFEKFKLLQDFNGIKICKINIIESKKGNLYNKSDIVRPLTDEEKVKLLEKFIKKSNLKISELRKTLNISYDYVFNLIDYDFREVNKNNLKYIIDNIEKNSKKELVEFKCFHELRVKLDKIEKGYILKLRENEIDEIATTLTLYKSDEKRITLLKEKGFSNEVIEKLLSLSFSKFSHLSIKAMKKIIPHLQQGLTYDKAVNEVYEDFRGKVITEKKKKLSLKDIEEITNPVVRRGVSQTIKVINAIVQKYGKPDLINIELARELSKNFNERKVLEKKMLENMGNNQLIVEKIKELNLKENINGQDIVKYKLWEKQNGICPYSGEKIKIEELFNGDVDIDHIIPYSKCFDDSYNNKVLVKAFENRMKTNRTPIEYLKESNRDIDEYIVRIQNMYANQRKKRENLLKDHFTEEDESKWKDRNLKDTQYITRVILNLIRNHLEFNENTNISKSKRVMAVKGQITSKIRKMLNIEKVREGDKHHAMDAAIIAITTESMIQKITSYEKNKEKRWGKDTLKQEEFYQKFPVPYEKFELELKARMKDSDKEVKRCLEKLDILEYKMKGYPKSILVSRMPKRKVKGSAHKETLAAISKNKGKVVEKKALTTLKLNKENEIEGYYNKQDDTLLYNALKERLIKYSNNAKEAFIEPFYKPKSDGSKGPLVKKVKIESTSTSNVKLYKSKAVAGNGDTVRIDVFYVENEGYYFIPIYVADTIKQKLPNKACVSGKISSEWKEMDDNDFIFSVYPGDLLYIKSARKIRMTPMAKDSKRDDIQVNEVMGYYTKCDISNACIAFSSHDRLYQKKGLGVKTLLEIKKYQVDVLGNYYEVKLPEKRMEFKRK